MALGILKRLGLHADVVANGAEAIKALGAVPYDLVLMDVQMPEMDGFEATGAFADPDPRFRITDPDHRHDRLRDAGGPGRCLEVGMNDYLAKPVSLQALADVLVKWLPKEGT